MIELSQRQADKLRTLRPETQRFANVFEKLYSRIDRLCSHVNYDEDCHACALHQKLEDMKHEIAEFVGAFDSVLLDGPPPARRE